jgi:uncharacterized membrane protein
MLFQSFFKILSCRFGNEHLQEKSFVSSEAGALDRRRRPRYRLLIFLVLLFAVTIGGALRVYHIGTPSLWWDELRTVIRMRMQPNEIISDLQRGSPLPPFYYLLLHYWGNLFGDSEFFVRVPSAIFSTLTIVLVYFLSRELFDWKSGLIAALLVAFSPYSIYYAQEAKMYSLLWCLGIASFFSFIRFCKNNKTIDLVLYCFVSLLSIYTLYTGFFFLIIQNIAFFCFFRRKNTGKWLLGQGIILLFFSPWVNVFLGHMGHKEVMKWIPAAESYVGLLRLIFTRILLGVLTWPRFVERGVIALILLIICLGIVTIEKRRRVRIDISKSDFLLFLWIVIPLCVYWGFNTYICPLLSERTERYVGFMYIPLCILIGKGIGKYALGIRIAVLGILFGITLRYGGIPLYGYPYRILHGDDWRTISQELRKRLQGDTVIVNSFFPGMVAYYNRDVRIMDIKTFRQERKVHAPASVIVYYRSDGDWGSFWKKRLPGYSLKENYYQYQNGFLLFTLDQ